MDFTEYDTRLAGYAVVLDADGRVLLACGSEGGESEWTMPGGAIEIDETIEDGVIREVREETGYDIELGPLLGIDTYVMPAHERRRPRGGRPLRFIGVVYAAAITAGELTNEINGTTDEARWFAPSDVAALRRSSIIDVALALAQRQQIG